ncbi:hypothetical protein AB0942_09610 [Streptomyces nodosus]|uniref:hypothetical protein n=1 Tax=Streptomyces nodosus TaxID=40318 RepID=UPI0034531A83
MTPGTVWIYLEGYRDGSGAARLLRADKADEIFQLGLSAILVNGADTVWDPLSSPSRPTNLPPQFLIALAGAVQTARHQCADGNDRVVTARHSETTGWRWQVYLLDEIPAPAARAPAAGHHRRDTFGVGDPRALRTGRGQPCCLGAVRALRKRQVRESGM